MSTEPEQQSAETAAAAAAAAAAATADKLSNQLARRGVDDPTWNTLKNSVFPGAQTASILMAIDYCLARKLDVLKKPCHIVPMEVKTGKKDQNGWDLTEWRDVIMPGIYELRTTAMRTGAYAGCSDVQFGEVVEFMGVKAPVSARMVVYRFAQNGQKIEFPATVYFEEAAAFKGKGDKRSINAMWTKRPKGQLDKCAEAAALRKAFPEELGGLQSADEMTGHVIGDTPDPTVVSEQGAPSRTAAATEKLRQQLSNQAGTGGLDSAINRELNREAVNAQQSTKQAEPAKAKQPTFKFDVASALALLRGKATVADLKAAYKSVEDDYEFSGRELPVDVEAIYRDLREALETKEATP